MLIASLKLGRDRVISLCGAGGKTTLMFSLAREFAAAGEKVLITTTTKLAMAECQGRFPVFKADSAGGILRRACFGPGAIVVHAGQSENSEKLIGFSRGVIDAVSAAGVFDRILIEADGSRRRPLKAPDTREPVFADTTDAVVIVAGLNGIGKVLCEETTFRAEIWSRLSGLKIGDIITPDSVARVIVHCDGAARRCPDGAKRVVFLNRADSPRTLRHARQIMRVLPGLAGRHPVHTVAGYLLPAPGIVDPA